MTARALQLPYTIPGTQVKVLSSKYSTCSTQYVLLYNMNHSQQCYYEEGTDCTKLKHHTTYQYQSIGLPTDERILLLSST